jgi:hypothetical protein
LDAADEFELQATRAETMANEIEKALFHQDKNWPFGVQMALVLIRQGEDIVDQLFDMRDQLQKAAKALRKGGYLKNGDIDAFQHIRRLHASWEEQVDEEDEPRYEELANLNAFVAPNKKGGAGRKTRRTRRH